MPRAQRNRPERLEDLPNIGKALAAKLRRIGIGQPEQLMGRNPLAMFCELSSVTGHRPDPCVLYTFLSVEHYLKHDEVLPWWKFTKRGKALLQSITRESPKAAGFNVD
jgi:DNA transformation protein